MKVASEIESYGAQAMTLSCDVSNRTEITDAIDSLSGEWADVDILVNNGNLATNTLMVQTAARPSNHPTPHPQPPFLPQM